jgi:hypothetical protein
MRCVLAVLLGLLAPGQAEASCGLPSWNGTRARERLPARGVLFTYELGAGFHLRHGRHTIDIAAIDGAITWTASAVGDSVIRIDYETTNATGVRLGAARYAIDPAWRPPTAVPRAITTWHEEHRWMCSWGDTLSFLIDQPTAAFRVRLAEQEWIVPADGHELRLGKIDCGDTLVDPGRLHDGVELELIAIRSDGSEVAVHGFPRYVAVSDIAGEDVAFVVAILFVAATGRGWRGSRRTRPRGAVA